ncbi:hypothetical protein ACFX2B_026916 [Malus domestica]
MGSFWPVQNSLLSKNQQAQPILASVSRPNIQIQQLKDNPLVKLLKAVDQDAASVFLAKFYGRACISFSKCKKKKNLSSSEVTLLVDCCLDLLKTTSESPRGFKGTPDPSIQTFQPLLTDSN